MVRWYADCQDELVSAAWVKFERVCANDLQLLPVEVATFHKAARMTMDPASGLRAGDTLHLAGDIGASVQGLVTLDAVFSKNAKRMKVKVVPL